MSDGRPDRMTDNSPDGEARRKSAAKLSSVTAESFPRDLATAQSSPTETSSIREIEAATNRARECRTSVHSM